MDYFLARYYSSAQGRFTSPDEFSGGPDELYFFAEDASSNPTFYADLLDPQSLNKYQYCYNNPLRYVDPDGHDGGAAAAILAWETAKATASTGNVPFAAAAAGTAAYFYIISKWGDPAEIGDGSAPTADAYIKNYVQRKQAELDAKQKAEASSRKERDKSTEREIERSNGEKPERRNVEVRHSTRKAAKEAAEHPHPGKKKPTPSKSDSKKRREYNEQQKYRNPESHPNSKHPQQHFHDRDKSKSKVNRHHTFPE